MCRFFSQSLNSHFYTAKPAECEDVKVKFAATWLFESAEVFRAFVVDPSTGICPTDTSPVYRLYNNRPDANHRYTDQVSVFNLMKAKGLDSRRRRQPGDCPSRSARRRHRLPDPCPSARSARPRRRPSSAALSR